MNTTLSGSGRVDDIKSHSQGEIRGQTKLVKITEDVRRHAPEQGVAEEDPVTRGLNKKAAEFRNVAKFIRA